MVQQTLSPSNCSLWWVSAEVQSPPNIYLHILGAQFILHTAVDRQLDWHEPKTTLLDTAHNAHTRDITYSTQCTLYTSHCILHNAQYKLHIHTAHYTQCNTKHTVQNAHCKLHTAHCTFTEAHYTLYSVQSMQTTLGCYSKASPWLVVLLQGQGDIRGVSLAWHPALSNKHIPIHSEKKHIS